MVSNGKNFFSLQYDDESFTRRATRWSAMIDTYQIFFFSLFARSREHVIKLRKPKYLILKVFSSRDARPTTLTTNEETVPAVLRRLISYCTYKKVSIRLAKAQRIRADGSLKLSCGRFIESLDDVQLFIEEIEAELIQTLQLCKIIQQCQKRHIIGR